jgi:Tol biopolymer transport system component
MRWIWVACLACWFPASALAGDNTLGLGKAVVLTDAAAWTEPAWSPDGALLSFAGEGSRGLYTVPAVGGTVREIVEPSELAVFRHHWSDPGTIHVPPRGEARALDVVVATGSLRDAESPRSVWIDRDDVVVGDDDGPRWLTHGQDRFIDPVISPDGTAVAFVGLTSGVHVAQLATGEVRHLGPGTRPCWTPQSDHVLFERTEDDGEQIVGSELWAWVADSGETFPLTATPDSTERHPAVSPDGATLAFVRDGAVVIAPLLRGAP